jgi:DNA-binding transcriptional LysR family regulator
MDLNKLKTFYTLARAKNYSRCARKLFVTQSAVSHAIKALEDSLELTLTEKRKNGFALTPEGQVLFKSCRTVFEELDRVEKQLLDTRNIPETIRLGATVEFGINVVIRQLVPFLEAHPEIHIDFTLSHNLIQPLLDDELDIIIDCKPHNRPELRVIPLLREEYAVIATRAYAEKQRISEVADLGRCNILSMDKDMDWWANFISALPDTLPIRITRITQINHIRGIIEACLASAGVGFVPRYTVMKHLKTGRLIPLFKEFEIRADQISLYMKERMAVRPAAAVLTEKLRHLSFK